ncbi:MAG TPA: efflux RND transporter periplasmic adaptor subunit [Thermoanaerobaculia bacterium]|nr:efflux RND transporter periplasmic adaptor subunit [Thermoanaerobaculia bacterium]
MSKKKKAFIAFVVIAVLAIAGAAVQRNAFAKEAPEYRFAKVERGDVQSTVSATGTLDALTTVTVGTQVSGQVAEIYADFNDRVKKGQLLARIDPTLAQQAVADAQANLEKAQAQALLASRDYTRNRELTGEGLVARSAFEQTQASAQVANAGVKSARVALERAQQNLSYTNIYAPIDGVVVARNVEKGQTVAASLSAPELFKIANDLSQMQIKTLVSESDIASIAEGQQVDFTVQALSGQTFKGAVRQVRLESTTQDNVVNYTVIVAVDNRSGKLLPGMTARAKFLTKSADDVLKVPNAALRFKPSEEQLAKLKETAAARPATSTAQGGQQRGAWRNGNGGARNGNGPRTFGTLYYLDAKGQLAVARVRTGVTDGTTTEITGRTVKEGMNVIAGVNTPQSAEKTTSASPFQSNSNQQQQRGPRGGGF